MGFGAVGIGTAVGGSESEGWALHRGLPPVVHREPNKTPKTGMPPHIGGPVVVARARSPPPRGREGVLATTGPEKRYKKTDRIPLDRPPTWGDFGQGGAAGPSRPSPPPTLHPSPVTSSKARTGAEPE